MKLKNKKKMEKWRLGLSKPLKGTDYTVRGELCPF